VIFLDDLVQPFFFYILTLRLCPWISFSRFEGYNNFHSIPLDFYSISFQGDIFFHFSTPWSTYQCCKCRNSFEQIYYFEMDECHNPNNWGLFILEYTNWLQKSLICKFQEVHGSCKPWSSHYNPCFFWKNVYLGSEVDYYLWNHIPSISRSTCRL